MARGMSLARTSSTSCGTAAMLRFFRFFDRRDHLGFPYPQVAVGQQAGCARCGASTRSGGRGIGLADFIQCSTRSSRLFPTAPARRRPTGRDRTTAARCTRGSRGQQAHGHALFGSGRVAGDGLLDAFVHAAVEIGEVQFKLVGGGSVGQLIKPCCSKLALALTDALGNQRTEPYNLRPP